ncbi:class I SAM-dependent methyltransferase [Gilvimarinus sp. SDUM040013]|uniref:Class I SAM-dependent methyltransferase n=1 Tax=Gilvimarinus gilvus TaxID=3058038 RepID=A0ABU4RYY3_9GAMM|nr:class I SAM-dependent methyltransferase [Gilvimarinus sp. SDUM040013]MDO3384555.1 class I SAM-dependent methyltransferase [Gilvimarinus sp. SDUM040013]MDX6850109.1 class I SAM-dependent methyltransferase [Gilvimarinus sp. SDUM040013]
MTSLPEDLTNAVYSYAVAQWRWPELQLIDRAAAELWDKLPKHNLQPHAQKKRVARSAWIDQRCLEFIGRHCNAEFVALRPGLNTRFYRLSQQVEWPRFCWYDLDHPATARYKHCVLPDVDNYQIAPFADPDTDPWLRRICGASQQPLMLIAENLNSSLSRAHWQRVVDTLHQAAGDRIVEIVYDGPSPVGACLSQLGKFLRSRDNHELPCDITLPRSSPTLRRQPIEQGLLSWLSLHRLGFHCQIGRG